MAVHLYCLPILNHILYFLLPDADERLLHPLLAAVAVKPGRHFLQDFQAEFTDDGVQNHFRGHCGIQEGGYRLHLPQLFLQLVYDFIRRPRKKLDNEASRLTHRIVFIH